MSSRRERLARLRFPAQADQLKKARSVVREAGRAVGCSPESIDLIVLAVDEACANIIRHAYGPGRVGDIVLELFRTPEDLCIRLTDFADSVDKSRIKCREVNEVRPGGLGVYLIQEIMDSFHFLEPEGTEGNVLEMRKRLSACRS